MSATKPATKYGAKPVSEPEVPGTMRAVVLPAPGKEPAVETVRTPVPRRGEVLVRVAACGVCHTDLHVLKGEVAFPAPAVLGHEISGTVVRTAEGVPDRLGLAPGTRVVGAFVMPCGECEACVSGRDDLCEPFFRLNRLQGVLFDGESRLARTDGSALAMYSMGGLAEYAVVPASALCPLPGTLPLEESAVLGCAALTAYGAVRRGGDVRSGESVAVVAMGGVGSSIVQVARASGAEAVIAVDVSARKLAAAEGLGATHTVDASAEDPVAAVRAAAGGRGVDVAFEALGRSATFEQAVGMLRDGGRMVAVGIAPAGTGARVDITPLVRRSLRIIGSYGARTRTDLPRVVALSASGRLRPHETVTRTFGLDEAAAAYAALDRGEIAGRAVIRPRPSTPSERTTS